MPVTSGNEAAQMSWNLTPFYQEWAAIKQRSKDAGTYYVRFQSRSLLQALAYATPIAYKGGQRGRARAGWWPAASVLGVTNLYTPVPNRGEGAYIDRLADPVNPMFAMSNTVPYIGTMTHGLGWFYGALTQVQVRAQEYLTKSWQKVMTGMGSGIG